MAPTNNAAAFLTLLTLVAAAAAAAGPVLSAEDCINDITILAVQCYAFVEQGTPPIPPSPECCDAIRGADLPCVCANIPPDMERYVSIEKAVDVCDKCGRPLEHGMKCGSYTVPMAW